MPSLYHRQECQHPEAGVNSVGVNNVNSQRSIHRHLSSPPGRKRPSFPSTGFLCISFDIYREYFSHPPLPPPASSPPHSPLHFIPLSISLSLHQSPPTGITTPYSQFTSQPSALPHLPTSSSPLLPPSTSSQISYSSSCPDPFHLILILLLGL